MFFRATQGVYYLFLGTWLGALVLLAIAAAVTFRTVREHHPALAMPEYRNLDPADQANVLAGAVVGRTLKALAVLQVICAGGVAVCLALQWTVFADRLSQNSGGRLGPVNLLRTVLLLLPMLILALDILVVTPVVWRERRIMFDTQLTIAQRAAARGTFARLHKLDERLVGAATFLLAGALVLSPWALE